MVNCTLFMSPDLEKGSHIWGWRVETAMGQLRPPIKPTRVGEPCQNKPPAYVSDFTVLFKKKKKKSFKAIYPASHVTKSLTLSVTELEFEPR